MVQYVDGGDVAIFDGLSFRRDKRTGYYLNSKTHKRLHVYVWEYYNGKVPTGHHVHHKDFDKSNNEIDNLVLMTVHEHIVLHGNSWSLEQYEKRIKNLNENVRPKASEWHKSEVGRKWHKEHFEKTKNNFLKKQLLVCEQCGKEFETIYHGNNRFCSNNCKAAYRRKMGIDSVSRKCEWCGKMFEANKYAKSRTCSKVCARKLYWDKKHKEN